MTDIMVPYSLIVLVRLSTTFFVFWFLGSCCIHTKPKKYILYSQKLLSSLVKEHQEELSQQRSISFPGLLAFSSTLKPSRSGSRIMAAWPLGKNRKFSVDSPTSYLQGTPLTYHRISLPFPVVISKGTYEGYTSKFFEYVFGPRSGIKAQTSELSVGASTVANILVPYEPWSKRNLRGLYGY